MSDMQTILPILKDNHPTLKMISEIVPEVTPEVRVIASQLMVTMADAKGVGISAVQCGILKRIVIMDTRVDREDGVFRVLINPEIIARKGSCNSYEGCLSFPGVNRELKRYKGVRVKYMDLTGTEVIEQFQGLSARCAQHEIDHTNGIVFTMSEAGIK